MAEEEVMMEVEAVQAVYGGDCTVLSSYPPHLRVHIRPRTADVSSQQFVEADIVIRAGPQYPRDPPDINVIASKGLDEERLNHLTACLHDKTLELASCLMLVALCEEAVESLSIMNHPDGNCPLCLYPLVPEDESGSFPFMKLMSCFHCFHSECIIGWWRWLQKQEESDSKNSSSDNLKSCPVCRKDFHAEDIEHVINLVGSQTAQMDLGEKVVIDSENLLESDLETNRRHKFETILQLQKDGGGLIEPRKDGVLFSSISITELIQDDAPPNPDISSGTITENQTDHEAGERPGPSGLSSRANKTRWHQRFRSGTNKGQPYAPNGRPMPSRMTATQEPYVPANMATPSQPRNNGWRKDTRAPQTQAKQWIRKERDGQI